MAQSDPLAAAKSALSKAEGDFHGAQAAAVGVKPAGQRNLPAVKAPAKAKPMPTTADELKAKQSNVEQFEKAQAPTPTGNAAPKMHTGGVVPKTGVYTLQEGETVIPVNKAAAGRTSEYRKVYLNRKTKTNDAKQQTRQGGGNSPVQGESHATPSKKLPYEQAQA